jgi:hypothetical protein
VLERAEQLSRLGPTTKSKRADKLVGEFLRVTDQFGQTWTLPPNTIAHRLVARYLADQNRNAVVVAQEIIRAPQNISRWLDEPVWRRLEAAADARPELVIGMAQWDMFRCWAVDQLEEEGFLDGTEEAVDAGALPSRVQGSAAVSVPEPGGVEEVDEQELAESDTDEDELAGEELPSSEVPARVNPFRPVPI